MEKSKSTSGDEMKNLINENKEFLSALNKGASSSELDEIRKRVKRNNEDELSRRSQNDFRENKSNERA